MFSIIIFISNIRIILLLLVLLTLIIFYLLFYFLIIKSIFTNTNICINKTSYKN